MFVFLEFCEFLSKLDYGYFFDAVVKIAVLEHFFKLLFWDLQDLAFGTFAFGCEESFSNVEYHTLLSKIVTLTNNFSLDVHLAMKTIFSALFGRGGQGLEWIGIVSFENNLSFQEKVKLIDWVANLVH